MIQIAEKAKRIICECVLKSEQEFEVGGILLGRRTDTTLRIETATTPENFQNCRKGSFQLDGKTATQQCKNIIKEFPELCVVGLWHSHLYGIDKFSSQDIQVNQWFASQYGNSASLLVVQKEKEIQLHLYELNENKELRKQQCLRVEEYYERENAEMQCL